ncbi:MAG: SDR family oxidoreductase [Solirubrobacteraceae bacterium]|jgi:NAD(P)-dependent dehydrogenase (short-subunit alcohol dehydrogenase family)|nr:SDR family oxidoreductase [Solirubrobacteraceae bacterium]
MIAGPAGDLGGRDVVVTGAGRGIGRRCAETLAGAGARVTLVARSAAELEAVAGAITAAGGDAVALAADVCREEDAARVVASLAGGEPWALVNAAGTNRTGPSVTYDLADWDAVMDVNVRGTFLMARAFAGVLLRAGRPGRVVNLSSQMGVVGYPGRAAYCASKHAVNGLTKALAVEWARDRITVNAVAPTFVETPLTAPMLADPAFREEVLRRIPSGELADIDDVAAAVGYLVSDAAASVTGQVLGVDGGWTAW